MHKIVLVALLAAAAPADAAGLNDPACYTQRTRPENVVLPRPRSAESLSLPAIHLPDASRRYEPVTVVLNMHVTETGSVDRVTLAETSTIEDWNTAVAMAAESWAFIPGTLDGEPTPMCFRFRLTATLEGN